MAAHILSADEHNGVVAPEGCLPRLASVGVPHQAEVRIVSERGDVLPVGEVGHLVARGDFVATTVWHAHARELSRIARAGAGRGSRLPRQRRISLPADDEDDLVHTRGRIVRPSSVESVVCTVAGVREVAVIGVPRGRREIVTALVSLCDDASVYPHAVVQHRREWLPARAIPQVVVLDELPRGQNGKFSKRRLRDLLAGGAGDHSVRPHRRPEGLWTYGQPGTWSPSPSRAA